MVALSETNRKDLNRVMVALSDMHEGNEGFAKRLKAAYNLIVNGNLLANGDCKSESGNGIYHTSYSGIPCQHHCTCQDFAHRGVTSDYGRMCKHTIANLLSYLAQIQLPTAFETPKVTVFDKLVALAKAGKVSSGQAIANTPKGRLEVIFVEAPRMPSFINGKFVTKKSGYALRLGRLTSEVLISKTVDSAHSSSLETKLEVLPNAKSLYQNFVNEIK